MLDFAPPTAPSSRYLIFYSVIVELYLVFIFTESDALTWSLFLYYPCLAPHLPDLLTIELISPNSLLAIGLIRPNSLLVGHWADFSQLPIKAIDMPTVHTRIPVEESALLATTACSTCNVQSVREENVCVPRTRALDHRHLHFPDTVRPPRTRAPRPL